MLSVKKKMGFRKSINVKDFGLEIKQYGQDSLIFISSSDSRLLVLDFNGLVKVWPYAKSLQMTLQLLSGSKKPVSVHLPVRQTDFVFS